MFWCSFLSLAFIQVFDWETEKNNTHTQTETKHAHEFLISFECSWKFIYIFNMKAIENEMSFWILFFFPGFYPWLQKQTKQRLSHSMRFIYKYTKNITAVAVDMEIGQNKNDL